MPHQSTGSPLVPLPALWALGWAADPQARCLADGTGRSLTRLEVERASRALASAVLALGVRRGDRVLLSCGPSIDTALTYVALLRAGLVVVPANTAYTPREVAHIVADASPTLAILDDEARIEALAAVHDDVQWLRLDVLVERATSAMSTDGSPRLEADAARLDAVALDDPALIGYTSGTTGVPKGALLSHRSIAAGAMALVEAWEWTPDDRLVMALPLFHMHGLGVGLNGTLAASASVTLLPTFDTDLVIDTVARDRGTMFFAVPTMYARLAQSPRATELADLRLAVSGSAPLSPTLHRRLHELRIEVVERYGMTETVMLTSNPLHGERRAGSVGLPLPGVQLRLADDGQVEVRGPNLFVGYWNRPDATAQAFTVDGWFRTGDVGTIDADGYLHLSGRASDLIITGGYNVYPAEVEDVLLAHADVLDAAVVGVPDAEWGERIHAFVVLAGDVAPTNPDWFLGIEQHARSELAAFKTPRSWHAIESLPRNAMGKVKRSELVAAATSV